MKKFISLTALRQTGVFVALVVVALVIWFLGPLVAFGGLTPLAGIGARVLTIVLLFAGTLILLAGWSVSIIFVALLCLLVWFASPLLSFGHAQPFEANFTRIVIIVAILMVFAIYGLIKLKARLIADKSLLKQILEFGIKQETSPAATRLELVTGIVDAALQQLKSMRTGARGLGRLFQGKRYLYELPWYITLGSKSAGKTTAVLNAGLAFPVAEQMQRAVDQLAATSGTANVDWWMTNDAVLIDTAGHYAQHGQSTDSVAAIATPSAPSVTIENPEDELSAATESEKTKASTAGADDKKIPPTEQKPLVTPAQVDAAEWHGFLALLRKHRPRMPINGAILTIDLATLTKEDDHARLGEIAALRTRLADLRTDLGIRFPVYLVVTKMDQLSGFNEYFGSLTAEGRSQIWGFTLPSGRATVARESLRARCRSELGLLATRLAEGVNGRLQDEHDASNRCKLVALDQEFSAMIGPLALLIDSVFLDSRYDTTQRDEALRGVYFTSAAQSGATLVAERRTILQRVLSAFASEPAKADATSQRHQSYFLQDLLTKVIFREARLVRPNLHWEFRFRLLRFVGHALAVLLFAWLVSGIWVSLGNNRVYLDAIEAKTRVLSAKVTQLYKSPKPEAVPDALTDARYLPTYPGLDLSSPESKYRYGLYVAPDVATESRHTYDSLEDTLLLPQLVHRMEAVLSDAIARKDSETAYAALRTYLMLQDKAKYNADDVKAWVLSDWANTDSAAVFGGRASMIEHVNALFSADRVVQSPFVRNDALIQQARSFLDANNATQRLYERSKAAMQKEAPEEFTLLRAVGPQAGTVFTRASGEPLAHGVPGLFTFDGYRNLFDKRLPEFVQIARDDDAWVMGRSLLGDAQKKTAEIARAEGLTADPLTEEVRRQYLMEYAQRWDNFLGDIRTVSGTSLAFNLQILRRFAAPDSPLSRLAQAAVRETTLTRTAAADEKSFLQKASGQINQKADQTLGIRAEERLERELVDSHFAALREVVTGAGDTPVAGQPAAPTGAPQLDALTGQLNDYYTVLTVADNALTNNSMPPASDSAVKLKLTAETLPAPFREVLRNLAIQGSQEVNQGIGQLLSRQMVATIGDACRLTVDGNYPFVPESKQDVSIDDFTRVFAQGGVIDDFFVKTLAPFVNTASRPWRYKTLPGATEPVQGPDLMPFQKAKAIREVFFTDPGQKKLSWKAEIKIPELDPTITGLVLDIDGQSEHYQHGPDRPFAVAWPGPRGGVHAEITANPRIRPDTSTVSTDGPWAFMRLLKKGRLIETATSGRTRAEFNFDGRKAVLDIVGTASVANPLTSDVLRTFQCPSSLPSFSLPDSGPPVGLPSAVAQPVRAMQAPAAQVRSTQHIDEEPALIEQAPQRGVQQPASLKANGAPARDDWAQAN
ncbi:type VI secretion system membrane subunit TssM [uncultured Caballeronia sp.]|jgi:type VI secretion system protein ImpL|uniref:type VI secretion system membrane subunit TssM n=1 Tax=uncultured Caballeronia sp. TaxID=1827198 RepID=UPI00157659D7